jgi:hypothetical protein
MSAMQRCWWTLWSSFQRTDRGETCSTFSSSAIMATWTMPPCVTPPSQGGHHSRVLKADKNACGVLAPPSVREASISSSFSSWSFITPTLCQGLVAGPRSSQASLAQRGQGPCQGQP